MTRNSDHKIVNNVTRVVGNVQKCTGYTYRTVITRNVSKNVSFRYNMILIIYYVLIEKYSQKFLSLNEHPLVLIDI